MSQSTVAKRYAGALFQLAQEKQNIAEINADFQELAKVIETNPELVLLLATPKFSLERKKQMVAEIFANANPVVIDTLKFLIDKKRTNEVLNIVEAFKELASAAQGFAEAKVYSTRELTTQEKEDISSSFGKLVGKEKLDIQNVIDPSLLGGVRVQIGNYIFDNTVAHKLESLKRTLIG